MQPDGFGQPTDFNDAPRRVRSDPFPAALRLCATGVAVLTPALCEWRAELAGVLGDDAARSALLSEAQKGYTAIGAPKHAERLTRELAN